jgi:hypothetical protein
MHKKPTMACIALVAIMVFVVAPTASASPALTDNELLLPPGTSMQTRSTGEFKVEGAFSVSCTNTVLNGTLTGNTGTKIKDEVPVGSASFTGTGTGGDCTSALGATKVTVNSKLCMETVTSTDNVVITGCGGNVTFTLEVTGTGACKYSTASITGTFKTNAAATVNVAKQPAKKEEGGFFCPAEGALSVDWDWYTTSIIPVIIS